MRRWLLSLSLLLVFCPAQAMPELQLVGEGNFRYFLWNLYEARLYSEQGDFNDYQQSAPVLLELTYQRSITKQQFIDATIDQWQHLAQSSEDQQQQWAEQLQSIWQDVSKGDRLAALLQPDMSVEFFMNDQPTGRIDDSAFGPAFFDIWLHPDTSAPGLRRRLLATR
ncbi:MAG: chalcone isomerase family protein [Alkalimonas sp.]|nr:chalcone isomerase family protein [Alkalimonas sp.]